MYQLGEIIWPNIYLNNQGINWIDLKKFKAEFNGQQRVHSYWSDRIKLNDWPDWAYKRYHLLLDDYRFSRERMNTLNKISQICKEHGIKFIIINMPVLDSRGIEGTEFISIKNNSPVPGFQTIFETSLFENIDDADLVMNIGNSEVFSLRDFGDPFHLNYDGSKKLAKFIAGRIKNFL